MRLKLTCILLLLAPFFGLAQARQQVTNMAGFDLSVNNFILTSSIGEPAILTLQTADVILTQGFLQPELLPCKELNFDYYPNPVRSEITITATGCDVKILHMELYDTFGRYITTAKPDKSNIVQLGDLSAGVFFMKVFLHNNETKTIKIIKVGTDYD
ncbi:MAG TPA: T9SS type A sorting domain-containing protein [Cyclobacteriaceae bacterium]|nr:T9SS type A sorting domain-containing protein [Cyclobacteriaceae bacterium]HRF33719.1 T9SS type A sorting domain-containing protein [Cyclobacteriaceae bacterium]